jgi:adenosylmethionine---8-amino-7-oxononanoate aminotransferase
VMPAQIIADLPRDQAGEAAFDALLAQHAHHVAAILVEPLVQGAGGMLFHDAQTLQRLRRGADKHKVLLIFDEIFTGFGRTGCFFAMEEAGVTPDIVTLSKALTGGASPLSAAIASERVFDAFWDDDPNKALMHGPTYMAHALGCAAANASLDLFEAGQWRADVARIEQGLREGLDRCRGQRNVVEVRVKGAIGVVEMAQPVNTAPAIAAFAERGCWIKPFGKIVYLTPALVATDDDVAHLTNAIYAVLSHG